MYGKPFNEKRPFGTIYGPSPYAFHQDGNYYNAQKEPVDESGNRLPLAPRSAAPEIPVASVLPVENTDDDIPDDEKPFDVLAWAQGDETLKATPWTKVKAEAATLLGDATGLSSKDAARKAILAHYGISA